MTIQDGIVYKGERIVIPSSMRKEMKEKAHAGHLGINSCLRRARDLIFWPGMSAELRQYIETCGICAMHTDKQPQETPIIIGTPPWPWQSVASDLFTRKGQEYMVTVDYHSNYFELDKIPNTTSETVIDKMKGHFARHGIPDRLITDNGTQYTSSLFKSFTRDWKIKHETISPGNSQANGAAEAAVKQAKRLLKKCKASGEDLYIGLLNLRNTPTEGLNTSPAQRLLGRRTKSLMPMAESKLRPGYINPEKEAELKEDRRAQAADMSKKDLKPLQTGDNIRMQPIDTGKTEWQEAKVTKQLTSRSYEVTTDKGKKYRRNRRFLKKSKKSTHSLPLQAEQTRRTSSLQPEQTQRTPSPPAPIKSAAQDRVAPALTAEPKSANPRAAIPPTAPPTVTPETVGETRSRYGRKIKKVVRMDV